jgi:hypothetical protein
MGAEDRACGGRGGTGHSGSGTGNEDAMSAAKVEKIS